MSGKMPAIKLSDDLNHPNLRNKSPKIMPKFINDLNKNKRFRL